MTLWTDLGKIEVQDAVLVDLVGLAVREATGIFDVAPRNLTENIVDLLGFEGRGRGVAIRSDSSALVISLDLQFWRGMSIASSVCDLVDKLQQLLEHQLGATVQEVHVEVAGTVQRSTRPEQTRDG